MSGPFESLIKLAPGTTRDFVPSLAESWQSSDDLSSWTFRLRDGVRFHDGIPCTAEAVWRSFERLFALALAPANVLGRFIQSMDQVRVVDDRTLAFDLGQPQRKFAEAMAAPFGTGIVNVAAALEHEVEGDWGHAWAQSNGDGLGTGPYRVVMERFDGYWGGWDGPHFDRIVVRVVPEAETRRQLIERGEADLVENISLNAVEELAADPALTVDRQTNLMVRYLAMTVADPLTVPEARQVLCWAFPYEEVLQGVFLGYAKRGQGPVAERGHGFSAPAAYSTDLSKARALFDQAGIAEGTTLWTVTAPGAPLIQTVAELMQRNLSDIGIGLDIVSMDYASYIGLVYGDAPASERPHLLPGFWQPDYDCAWSHLWPLVSCDAWSSGNTGHYCNDLAEDHLAVAKDTPDEADYLSALAEAQQIVSVDDPAGIYFAQPEWSPSCATISAASLSTPSLVKSSTITLCTGLGEQPAVSSPTGGVRRHYTCA